jgi:hypothetical protein
MLEQVNRVVVERGLVHNGHVPGDEVRRPGRQGDERMHRDGTRKCDRKDERREVAEQQVLRHVRRERPLLAPRGKR